MQQNISGCFSIKNIRNILTDRKSTSNFKNFTKLLAYARNNRRTNSKIVNKQHQNECAFFCVKKNSKLFELPQNHKTNIQPHLISKSKHFTLQKLTNLPPKILNSSEQLSWQKQSVIRRKDKQQAFLTQTQSYNRQRSPQKINLKFNPQEKGYKQKKKKNRYYMIDHLKQKPFNSICRRQNKNYAKQSVLQKMTQRIDTEINSTRQIEEKSLNLSIISPTHQKTVLSHKNIPIIQTVYFSQSPLIIKKKNQQTLDQSSLFKNAVSIHQIRKISKKMFLNQVQIAKQTNLKSQQTEKLHNNFRSKTRTNTQFNKLNKHRLNNNDQNVLIQTQNEEIICGW